MPCGALPLSRNWTTQVSVAPCGASAATVTVSAKAAVAPLVTCRASGVRVTVSAGSQRRIWWVTVLGRLVSPSTMASLTCSASMPSMSAPSVAATRVSAWPGGCHSPGSPQSGWVPSPLRPSPIGVSMSTATVRAPMFWSRVTVAARVWPMLGSLLEASPMSTMIGLAPARNSVAPPAPVPICHRALIQSSAGPGLKPPRSATMAFTPSCTAVRSWVSAVCTSKVRSPSTSPSP